MSDDAQDHDDLSLPGWLLPDGFDVKLPGYTIVRVLGRGAMGVVYLAKRDDSGQLVAVKTVRATTDERTIYVRRLKREALALRTMSHPSIAAWIDLIDMPTGIYLVMEYVPGWYSLGDLLKRHTRIDSLIAATIIRQAINGLAYAESLNIIHRDIKPDNILIAHTFEGPPPMLQALFAHPDTRVMLIDFGLTKGAESPDKTSPITRDGTAIGSPVYMAPEQALGQKVDFRTDMYALGVTFFQLLTGTTPFTADSPMEALQKKVNLVDFPRPSEHGVMVPPEVEDVLLRMVAYKPLDRYHSYAGLSRKLDEIIGGTADDDDDTGEPKKPGLFARLFGRRSS